MLHDGSALVTDFGIALAVSSAGGAGRMTEITGRSARSTLIGVQNLFQRLLHERSQQR